MIHLTAQTPVMIHTDPADFRRGIDGFVALCRDVLVQDPRCGTRFVFINRARTMVRVLTYDEGGFWLMTKRLSKGRFHAWPREAEGFDAVALRRLLNNLSLPQAA